MALFPHDHRLNYLKQQRHKHRVAKNLHHRLRKRALRAGKKAEAKVQLVLYRRHREAFQKFDYLVGARRAFLKRRKKANIIARKLRHQRPVRGMTHVVWFDGKMCSEGIAHELARIRAGGRWKGVLVSGFRDPELCERLCYGMCGRPSCPGRCAGRSSNHTKKGPGREGAADVSDYWTFAEECRRLGSWLENHLPADRVHFSDSGN